MFQRVTTVIVLMLSLKVVQAEINPKQVIHLESFGIHLINR